MTRKDYIAIAAALKSAHKVDCPVNSSFYIGIDKATNEIAEVLAKENPRFDRSRFLKAASA